MSTMLLYYTIIIAEMLRLLVKLALWFVFQMTALKKKTIIKFPISLKMLVLFLDILVLVVYVFPWPFIAIEARQEECFFNNIKCLTNNKNIPLPISRNRRLITKPFW